MTQAMLEVFMDGACRGNPGPASAGVVVRKSGKILHRRGFFLGKATNNIAEYTALIRAVAFVRTLIKDKTTAVQFYSDSELMVRQVRGEYKVKDRTLQGLWYQASVELLKLSHWSIQHIPREQNREADRMANRALDEEGDVTE